MMTRNEAGTTYNRTTAAVGYILGAVDENGTVYRAFYRGDLPISWMRITRESSKRGGAHKLALQKDKVTEWVLAHGKPFCSWEDIKPLGKLNAGERFEFLQLREFEGTTTWVKDSTPYWIAGDLTIGGEQWQVKLGAASLARLDLLEGLT